MSPLLSLNLREFTHGYVNNSACLIDNPEASIADRYGAILMNLEEARRRKIYEQFDDVYERVYKSGTVREVAASGELSKLQFFFYMTLYNNQIGRSHINLWHAANAEKWALKFMRQFEEITPASINFADRSYVPAKLPEKVHHGWLH